MAVKEIILDVRQCFGGKWYPAGTYTRATFLGKEYADGNDAAAAKMWARFVYKANRHPDCPTIHVITDKKPAAEPKPPKEA